MADPSGISDQLTRELTGFFICELHMETGTILFPLKTRCENCCLICMQKIALILLVICDQLRGALVFFFCELQMKTVTIFSSLLSADGRTGA